MTLANKGIIRELFLQNAKMRRSPQDSFYESLADGVDPDRDPSQLPVDHFFALKLKLKDKLGKLRPFVMNRAQYGFEEQKTGRDIILKARQLGFSTKIQGDHMRSIITLPGQSVVTIANEGDNTSHLVEIFDRFYNHLPEGDQPHRKGRYPYGINFPTLDSVVYIGTAGNRKWGRGKTVHHVHASEVAFWPRAKETMDGLLESVPGDPGTSIVMESTPNGAGGYFYEEVQKSQRGAGKYKVHFYPWWWAKEYQLRLGSKEKIVLTNEEQALIKRVAKNDNLVITPEQIKWRREKIVDRQEEFAQEYPESIVTCFLTSGRPRFNLLALNDRVNTQCRKPVYEDFPVVVEGHTYHQLRIYHKVRPGAEYVIGADVAEGIMITSGGDTDYSAAVVREKRRNIQVATIHGRFEPIEFAFILHEIGRYYNNAVIGVERNNHGHAVLGHLIQGTSDGTITPYQNLYVHEEDDRPGWPTTPKTRPTMIAELAMEYSRPEYYVIRDEAIIGEALQFVVKHNGKAEAADGAHDDLVFADGIASMMRNLAFEVRQIVYDPVHIGDF